MLTCISSRLTLYITAIIMKHLRDVDIQITYSLKQITKKMMMLNNFLMMMIVDLGCQGVASWYHISS